jgi:hypothetical protein
LTEWLEAHRKEIELGEVGSFFFRMNVIFFGEISVAMFGARRMKEWKSQLLMRKSDRLTLAP